MLLAIVALAAIMLLLVVAAERLWTPDRPVEMLKTRWAPR